MLRSLVRMMANVIHSWQRPSPSSFEAISQHVKVCLWMKYTPVKQKHQQKGNAKL